LNRAFQRFSQQQRAGLAGENSQNARRWPADEIAARHITAALLTASF
jgi:hypothetical protein